MSDRVMGWKNTHPFAAIVGLGIVLYFIAERVPLINGLVGWIVLISMPILWSRWNASALTSRESPVGYAVGIGVLVGALVDLIGAILNTIFLGIVTVLFQSMGNATGLAGATGAGLITTFSIVHWFIAPFVGGFLGALGGLIGGASLPRSR
ncbi:hypothetical protein [Sulfobacillus thermosulfidooxidans]|uniref:hypothetical protein n=1 Tax=Sulfobacillus thermosulfidooxidans TaxID=28034 RepID=UPI0006B5894C|nr:hypothetical protein [Sulfobacillus thermosulfidooxidans]